MKTLDGPVDRTITIQYCNPSPAGPATALHDAIARCVVALCWEAVGAMTAALEMTVEHARQRVQFGRPLIQFQVIEHRLAEMAVCCEESLAACELATAGTAA